ncbi:MAG TPA: hypothetical protein VF765_38085 [Polyangiaceae bacterium]
MAAVPSHIPIPELLWRLQSTLRMTQKELGALVGLSSRTIIRRYQSGMTFLPSQWATLAKALQPRDAVLAAYCAQRAAATIAQLVTGQVPPLPALAQLAETGGQATPAAAPPTRPMPSQAHLADSVVCAGAEAMQCTPAQMRPGLLAALARMVALGMNPQETLDAMSPPVKGDKTTRAEKTK